MNLQNSDGLPLTFNLPDAARLTGTRITSLRNYIARGILKHVGRIPLAGDERRFNVTGLVEVAIIDALSESLVLADASRVADHIFRMAYATAILNGSMERQVWMGSSFPPDADAVRSEQTFRDTFLFDANPHHWMKGPQWEHDNLADPVFCVFALTGSNGLCFDVAFGWEDVRRAYSAVASQACSLPPSEALNTAVPHVQLLNLTAILTMIRQAIAEKLTLVQA